MELLKLAALCTVCILPVVLLRKQTPEQALLLTIAILAVAAARCVSLALPLMEELRALFDRAGIEPLYLSILLRTLAAALVTRLCADLCKDGGSQALASAVETAGAVAALAIAMPLLKAVIELLLGYF
ncbi:MAG: stage III sporulation protein AD [Oscillospiraceae bacterium]|nr:stage III sporulation protein AD [Oscillospiraceae bacterium]